jgi:hypothetical protein
MSQEEENLIDPEDDAELKARKEKEKKTSSVCLDVAGNLQ